jgi:hypothetical protein
MTAARLSLTTQNADSSRLVVSDVTRECSVCGQWIKDANPTGICQRSIECRRARARVIYVPKTSCRICGRWCKRLDRACSRTPECRAAQQPKRRRGKPCLNCGNPTTSKWGVCHRKESGCHAIQERIRQRAKPKQRSGLFCLGCGREFRMNKTRLFVCLSNPACQKLNWQVRRILKQLENNNA